MPVRDQLFLTRAQVREIDRRAVAEFGIPGVVLMENAGRNAADLIASLAPTPRYRIAIVCGGGNNGGDGYVIARHLHNRGFEIDLFPAMPIASLKGDAAMNGAVVEKMRLPRFEFDSADAIAGSAPRLHDADMIVDALLGTGFSGAVRPPLDSAIEAINAAPRAIRIAIDVPSGLDCNTGQAAGPAVRAQHTITFVAQKTGFSIAAAAPFLGKIHVADIGAPVELIERVLRGPTPADQAP